MTDKKRFTLDGYNYEYLVEAQDQGQNTQGKMAIYRELESGHYFVMPWHELELRLKDAQPTDWHFRLDLYKRRFVGRNDVYAKRYFNKKMQRKAYSPDGPFENGRPSKEHHYPLTDDVLLRHLKMNDFAIGLYPLTTDNTTPFLAIDIDGHRENQPWQALTQSLKKVCFRYQVPILIELSQSGKGCHVWLFFDRCISALQARKLGDALLRATQSIDPRLPFAAFDRLFPAQNQLGAKQLGNLIAAPLEGSAVAQGKSVFVNDDWQPLSDQWRILNNIAVLNERQVNEITAQIDEQIGFRLYDEQPKEENLFDTQFSLDKTLTIIRANALYIKKSELTDQEKLQLEWLASFRNPQFYEAQARRMPIHNIPRIISLFKESHEYLIIPRGLEDTLRGTVRKIIWVDKFKNGHSLNVSFNGELKANQEPAFSAMMGKSMGILSARTGFGKTVIAAKMIAERVVSTLILVKNKTLAVQWLERLNQFLTIENQPVIQELTKTGRKKRKQRIGTYYGNKKNPSGLVDVATIQSIGNLDSDHLEEFLNHYGMVISDEVHHDAAYTYDKVICRINSEYIYGLSATPYRRDGQEPIIMMRFGPIRYQTEAIDPEFALTMKRKVIPRFTNFGMTNLEVLQNGIVENREAIMHDTQRDKSIIRDANEILAQERHGIILTSLIEHVDQLYQALPQDKVFRLYGRLSAKERQSEIEKINQTDGAYIILATTNVAGEGLDIATLDTMILAMPVGHRGSIEQYVGRLHRRLSAKKDLRVYDYVDMFVPMMMYMYRKRKKAYRHLEYEIVNDDFSAQKGLQIFKGNYQSVLSKSIENANNLLIIVPILKPYLRQMIVAAVSRGCEVQLCTQEAHGLSELLRNSKFRLIKYTRNLVNYVIIDNHQLWMSPDSSFDYNRGMTVRLDHPELIKQFKEMIVSTMSGFEE